jgi:hypothetical protein
MFRLLAAAFGCSTALLAAVVLWPIAPRFENRTNVQAVDQDIIFANKEFQSTERYVYVIGTLSGDWIGYKNNTYSILCTEPECIVAYVELIGPKQIGQIWGPTVYPVVKWSDDEIIASDDGPCSKITWTIERSLQEVLYVETPINQTAISCASSDTNIARRRSKHLYFGDQSIHF